MFLNATRSDRTVHSLSLREKWINAISCDEREEFAIAAGTIEVCSLHFKGSRGFRPERVSPMKRFAQNENGFAQT